MWEGGGSKKGGWGRWGKTYVQNFSNRFLKTLTEGAYSSISQPSPKMPTKNKKQALWGSETGKNEAVCSNSNTYCYLYVSMAMV